MQRRQFLKISSAAAVSTLLFSQCAEEKQSNIIFIMVDDFGYECLGCNGSTSYQTPHIDQLAESGVRFEHAYSTPLCTPTRVQVMTGQYNFRNYTEFGSLPPGEFTFGHLLQQAGYKTCVAGKWQLAGKIEGTQYRGQGTLPQDAGFDEHCLWQVKHKGSRYWNPTINENGVLHEQLRGEFGPDVFTDYITDFITRHQSDPFFVYYPMALTHNPFVPTPHQNPTGEEKQSDDPSHFKYFVEYTDSLVGRIVETLDRLNLRENTLIVFTGDNGTKNTVTSRLQDKSIRGDKGNPTVYGTHVPLIVNWKDRIAPKQVNKNLIDFTDFFVTFAEAAGIAPPADLPLDGQSFLPQLLGQPCETRDWVFCHYEPRWSRWQPARFVHDRTWKLYQDGRIYNIARDPLEENIILYSDLDTAVKQIIDSFKAVLENLKGVN